MTFTLIPCDSTGQPMQAIAAMPPALIANCQATAALYERVGYVSPWIGYVAAVDGQGVGGGAFVGPPDNGYAEIAYFTLEGEQGKGYATQTAAALLAIAREYAPHVRLKAFTLPEENGSTRILRGLGFSRVGVAHDVDAGEVWEWHA
jgi:RimJ/RimL family protein N-acetyltransferase